MLAGRVEQRAAACARCSGAIIEPIGIEITKPDDRADDAGEQADERAVAGVIGVRLILLQQIRGDHAAETTHRQQQQLPTLMSGSADSTPDRQAPPMQRRLAHAWPSALVVVLAAEVRDQLFALACSAACSSASSAG